MAERRLTVFAVRVKYVLHPGPVRSRTDGQVHHINERQLAFLYGVDMRECVVHHPLSSWTPAQYRMAAERNAGLIALRPDPSGRYELPKSDGYHEVLEIAEEVVRRLGVVVLSYEALRASRTDHGWTQRIAADLRLKWTRDDENARVIFTK